MNITLLVENNTIVAFFLEINSFSMAVAIFKKWESFLRNVHDNQIMRKVIQPTVHMIWLNPDILTVINKKQTSPTKINECMWMTLAPSDILPIIGTWYYTLSRCIRLQSSSVMHYLIMVSFNIILSYLYFQVPTTLIL